MARKSIAPAKGLYKNGRLWWIRTVSLPLSGRTVRLSTGTADVARANAVLAMVRAFESNPTQYHWLERAGTGGVTLDRVFTAHAAGRLHLLEADLAVSTADLRSVVDRWLNEYVERQSLDPETKAQYRHQIRALVPADKPFPAQAFTSDTLSEVLAGLRGARHDPTAFVSDTTKRHYVATWRLFYSYARPRVQGLPNPFEDETWIPAMGSPRMVTWTFETVQLVLSKMTGEARVAMALVFGSGIELGALLGMHRSHLGSFAPKIEDDERAIVAPGTKNEHREERTIFVDRWAWAIVREYAKDLPWQEKLFSYKPSSDGRALRNAFYRAQLEAGLIAEPTRREAPAGNSGRPRLWGQLRWGLVKPHTIHDARHTYCEIRGLGLDGEPEQDITFLAHQLGHADEQMVMRVYKKKNMKARLEAIRRKRALEKAA